MATYYSDPVGAYTNYTTTGDMPGIGDLLLPNKGDYTDDDSLMPPLREDLLNNNVPDDPDTAADEYTDSRSEDNLYARGEYGFPKCATDPGEGGLDENNFSLDPRRLVVVAAIVNCEVEEVNGKKDDVLATYFVETFISQPVKGDPVDKTKFDMYVEIIGPPLNIGVANTSKGTFRNLVQIYR